MIDFNSMNRHMMKATTHQTTSMILWAIKNHGLEKTLEDLHKNCTPWTNVENWTERNYDGFLFCLKDMNQK